MTDFYLFRKVVISIQLYNYYLAKWRFSALFSKYVLFVWNKLCPPIKWLIFRRVWWLLMLLTVLELISQSSNFSRITFLRNGVFSPLFSKYVRFVWNKLCPPIKWVIFRRAWWLLILLTVLELISQSSNFARTTILRNGVFSPLYSKYVLFVWNKLCPPIKWLR